MIMALSLGPHNIIEAEREWVVDLPVKIFGLDGKYTGQTRYGTLPEGMGRHVAESGQILEGKFHDGDMHGFMRIIHKEGNFAG